MVFVFFVLVEIVSCLREAIKETLSGVSGEGGRPYIACLNYSALPMVNAFWCLNRKFAITVVF